MGKIETVNFSDKDMLDAYIIAHPELWAEAYLRSPMYPEDPLVLRSYQNNIIADQHYRKLLRMGRRTGKSVILAVTALWRAFTNSYRQVLITAAYETQIDNIFDIITRLSYNSPSIKNSIVKRKQKPHFIKYANESTISGLVANSSIRGECLAGGNQVWMADMTYKSIEDVKVGDRVVCFDPDTDRPVSSPVTKIYDRGVKDVYKLTTTSARQLLATDNHPVFVFRDGAWKHIKDLKTQRQHQGDADFIAVLTPFGEVTWSRVKDVVHYGKLATYDIEVEKYHHFVSFYPNSIEESGFGVSGVASGGLLVHNSADDLIIDEGDYIPKNVLLEDVWPISTTYAHTTVVFSSTPSGRREFFWEVSTNKNEPEFDFHEFHIPSSASPEWTASQEALVRKITTDSQYDREYEANFGESLEGVFTHTDIDACSYVYSYEELRYNPDNYYTMGVDWNEEENGVRIVILEFLNKGQSLIPYKSGTWIKTETVNKRHIFKVYKVEVVDAKNYVNTKAIDLILEIMSKIKLDWALFDHGHGHTNWELLRLAIKKGKSATGQSAVGASYMKNRMGVVDFGSTTVTIDPIDNTETKHSTKNLLVKLAVRMFREHRIAIPARNTDNDPVEDDKKGFIKQLRDYNIARIGQKGHVYQAGTSGDHTLDAFLLALYAYAQEHDQFLHYDFAIEAKSVETDIVPSTIASRMNEMNSQTSPSYKMSEGGVLIRDYGNWAYKGEPPDDFDTGNLAIGPRRINGRTSVSRIRKGYRSL